MITAELGNKITDLIFKEFDDNNNNYLSKF